MISLAAPTTQKHAATVEGLLKRTDVRRGQALRIIRRAAVVLLVTIAIAALLDRSHQSLTSRPAGFGRGIIDGALMPGTLPPLLLGRDVTIYAANNTGRTYKLGYTVGVNGCGALFFGLTFWRVTRWRRGNAAMDPQESPPAKAPVIS